MDGPTRSPYRPSPPPAARRRTWSFSRTPFPTTLSLRPLLRYWEQAGAPWPGATRQQIARTLAEHPELTRPIDRPGRLAQYQAALEALFLPVLPHAAREHDAAAVVPPFSLRTILSTPSLEALLLGSSGLLGGHVTLDLGELVAHRVMKAYARVLDASYGLHLDLARPVTTAVFDAKAGFDRFVDVDFDFTYVDVEARGERPALGPDTWRTLAAATADTAAWQQALPPDRFALEGFAIMHAWEATGERVPQRLAAALGESATIIDGTAFVEVGRLLGMLLGLPGLRAGLAAYDGTAVQPLSTRGARHDILFTRATGFSPDALAGSVFEAALADGGVRIVEDLAEWPRRTPVEDELLEDGVRALVVAPLREDGQTTGLLYLWSSRPGRFDGPEPLRLMPTLPLFAQAVRRARADLEARVQNVILGEYAALHPCVEWRFKEAAMRRLDAESGTGVEPIVFRNVYPLYGATDIRGSSEHRNEAVRHDLLEHLAMAADVLSQARRAQAAPLLDHLIARAAHYRAALEAGFSSGDETAVRAFLANDLDPLLEPLGELSPEVVECVERYRAAGAGPEGALYARCRDFDASVQRLNSSIGEYLDAEQARIQGGYPHYFERQQTDGVAFTLYAGASLLEAQKAPRELLSVLRLWQLLVMLGVAARARAIGQELPVPLRTTHLILVQDTPIDIRFRYDEQRFDVDGTNHVRYEIMKQRVDKAYVRGTDERVTQPDQIAIVYSQDREIAPYERYVQYAVERGWVEPGVEHIEIDDLPGMRGLQALRIRLASGVDALPDTDPAALRRLVRGELSG